MVDLTVLQGMNQFILAGVGFDDLQAGEGNTLYQIAAAVVGVGLCVHQAMLLLRVVFGSILTGRLWCIHKTFRRLIDLL